jgi:hypothetical protein
MSEERYNIMKEFGALLRLVYPIPPFVTSDINDTTLVLLSTSLVDKFLKIVLIAGFQEDVASKRRMDDVFSGYGVLATFSAKISLCTMLGLTSINSRHDLTVLRKIRNDFAHSHEQLFLSDFSGCLSLKVTSKLDIQDPVEERLKLKQSCFGIIGELSSACLTRTAQFRFLKKNPDGIQKEYEILIKEGPASDE